MSTTFLSSAPIWTRRIANELWSGPVTPLTYSLLAEPMADHMVRVPLRTIGLDGLAGLPVFRHHASHVYVNAELLVEVIRRLPGGLRSEGLLTLLPDTARAGLGPGASWLTGGIEALTLAERAWRTIPDWPPWARAQAFDRECVEVRRGFETRGTFDAKPSDGDLQAELVHVAERLGRYLDVVSWGMVFAYVFFHLLHELVRHWAPGRTAEAAALTVGLPGIASLEAHYDVRAVGQHLAADPTLASALAAGDGAAVAAALASGGGGRAGEAFRTVLRTHGHRMSGRDLSCPTWRESPALVMELAAPGGHAIAPLDRAAVVGRRLTATAHIIETVGAGLTGLARRTIFGLVLGEAQRYYALRENMRYHADFFLARLRQVALAFGAALVARGALATADDAFWLDVDELVHGGPDLAARVATRRGAAARDAEQPPPETLDAPATATVPPSPGVLVGEAAAPGCCTGPVRLVRGPADFERVAPGDVVVAVYTDPGWMPVLERAAGLVLEAGGVLSHGAIVARELGIPALVGVADATRALRDGDLVTLDADARRITRRAPAPG